MDPVEARNQILLGRFRDGAVLKLAENLVFWIDLARLEGSCSR